MCSMSQISSTEFKIDQNLSIYISYVADENANEEYIRNVFKYLNIGDVKRVDFQPKISVYSNESFGKVAFVHMKTWYKNICVENLQERIMNNKVNKEARIVHNDPSYWVLKRNKRDTLDNSLEKMNERIAYLEQQNSNFETKIGHLEWMVGLHDANIRYLCNKVNIDTTVQSTYLPQLTTSTPVNMFNDIWGKRLRKRFHSINYHENREVD